MNTLFRRMLVAAIAVAGVVTLNAQSNYNQDEVVKIENHAARQYREGEMIVKFKSGSAVRMRAKGSKLISGVNKVDQLIGELGIGTGEQLMPLSGAVVAPQRNAVRSVTGKTITDTDLSTLYRLTFDPSKLQVHEVVDRFKALDEVEFAEPNYLVHALATEEASETYSSIEEFNDYLQEPLYAEQWGIQAINLPLLWAQPKITTKRPVIAIVDTGVDITHPDLADNIWTNEEERNGTEEEDDDANGYADDLHGWDFVNQTGRMRDNNGHGTHCAGIAAAVGRNGKGIVGANPDALIMPLTVMQSDGIGDVATIIKGIDYAAANGADVISMSIGGYGYSMAEEQALAKAYNKAVLVAAAGNDCLPINPTTKCPACSYYGAPMFPAAFTFVLGVEASAKGGGRASFSNYDDDGPVFSKFSEEKLYNYELRAPGANIMSTYPGGKYKALNGTSMACPLVAGALSRYMQSKEYNNKEVLFGDLIHTAKENLDIFAAYNLTDADRKPTLGLVTYALDDAEGGDGDNRPDAGETIAFFPTLRNSWGQAENITFSLSMAENEDTTVLQFLDSEVSFGKPLSSYGKNKSLNPLRFKVNPDCVDGRKICMVLRATCDNISEELAQKFTLTVENGVEIGGMITKDLTLYPNVHYIVSSNLAVPDGVTLTIKPGTVLKFKDGTGMSISGNADLICHGTPDSMIVFTKTDLGLGKIGKLTMPNDSISYTKIEGIEATEYPQLYAKYSQNCIWNNNIEYSVRGSIGKHNNYTNNYSFWILSPISVDALYGVNICNDLASNGHSISDLYRSYTEEPYYSNIFNNFAEAGDGRFLLNDDFDADLPTVRSHNNNYYGSAREDIARIGIHDMQNPIKPRGFGVVDLTNMVTRPNAEAHGVVWKVVVNGYDAQDEFEMLPPLGVGRHKFEVYFSRPMDKSFTPMIAMGVRPPYTSHSIAEEGSWNEEGTVYTAYLTIDGKTGADGLNRIYVADAVESFEDYYTRLSLQQLSLRIDSLLQEVVAIPGEVLFQNSNPSGDGYLSGSGSYSSVSELFDDNVNNFVKLSGGEYLQVDLGTNNNSRYIRFNYSTIESWKPSYITVQGSNDGVVFNDVTKISQSDKTNPLPPSLDMEAFWESLLIDATIPYRYYRFVFGSYSNISRFGMKTFDLTVKDTYKHLLPYDEALALLKNVEHAYDLCLIESRETALLKSTLDQMYVDYNKLANILQKPLIEQEPVEVISAPAWVVPLENARFNVQVAAAGSMATGLMAEAGMGKVNLTWETDEEDYEDLLGYNIYRYTTDTLGVSSDSIIINETVLAPEDTAFVDYNVVPGTTYYYVIKQLTTSLNAHALSNAVAATPLTASRGDANGSTTVDIADVVSEVAYITYQNPQPFIFEAADVNADLKVNVLDVVGTLNIITHPEQAAQVSACHTATYSIENGILYVETPVTLGGVQVRLQAPKGTEFKALESLNGFEQTGVWQSDNAYLFLAYSMVGRTLEAGKHALLQVGNAAVDQVVLSDARGSNVYAVDGNATGIGAMEAMQLRIPNPNPFAHQLHIPYLIGKEGMHQVQIVVSDLTGRAVYRHSATQEYGEYTHTWRPAASMADGIYLVTLYVDGRLMQTAKVIRKK